MNWRSLLLPLGALLACWGLLIHQLGAQWSVYAQYRYGWAVPALCAYLVWQRLRGRPLRLERGEGRGEVSNSGQPSSGSSASLSGSSQPSTQSGVEPPPSTTGASRSCPASVSWLSLCLLVLCALLYAPTRWLHEANPIWRLTGWLLSLEVIAITLLLVCLLAHSKGQKSESPSAPGPPSSANRSLASALAFPICFFLVAVPWPTIAERWLVDTLTAFNVTTTIELLNLFGLPALQHGNLIEITTGVVGVNEACSGIRSFQATLMLSLFFGELYSLTTVRRIGLCLLGFASSFVFNVGRTFMLTYVASRQGVPALEKWHDPAGITVLVWCFVAIWFASLVMKPAEEKETQRGKRRPGGTGDSPAVAGGVPGTFPQSPPHPSLSPGGGEGGVSPGEGDSAHDRRARPESEVKTIANANSSASIGGSSGSGLQLSAFRLLPSVFGVGLLLWLVLVEVGVEWWYRAHERTGSRMANWALRTDGPDSNFTRIETPEEVLRQFNADENTELRWRDDLGAQWQLYYFRWLPAASLKKRVSVQLAKTHGPEKCLPAAGMKLASHLGVKRVRVGELTLALQHYVFDAQGRPVHVFYAIYEDPSGTEVLANRRRDAASRVAAARAGSRNYGQHFLELAVWGMAGEQQAEAALQRQLEKLIRVEK
jgi:exosortase/archaeosortase family protein